MPSNSLRHPWYRTSLQLVVLLAGAFAAAGCTNRERDPRRQKVSQFSYIANAIQCFQNAEPSSSVSSVHRNCFGQRLGSWRAYMPVEQVGTPFDYSLPWFDPRNHAVSAYPNALFCLSSQRGTTAGSLDTQVCGLIGHGSGFGDGTSLFARPLPPNVIVLIEVADSHLLWMEPGDLDIQSVTPGIVQGADGMGLVVAFADGEAWFLDCSVPLIEINKFLTTDEARRYDREKVLGRYCKYRFNSRDR